MTDTVQTRPARTAELLRRLLLVNKALLFAIIFGIALTFASPYFLTTQNLLNLLQQIVVLTIVALAVTLVIGAAEIDLSIGGQVALIGVIMATCVVRAGIPFPVAILIGILVGAACGAANAFVITQFALPPFIVTLASNSVFIGIVYIATNLQPISGLPEGFTNIGQGYLGPIPISIFVLVPFAILIYLVAKRTTFGRYVVAFGGNPEAVRLSGIRLGRLRLGIYVLIGVACGLASTVLTAQSASAQIGAGSDLMLNVIAAVVIGGTPLLGGRVDMVGTFFGCITIGMISNGLNLIGVNPNFQVITQGLIILLALITDVQSTKLITRLGVANVRRALKRGEASSTSTTPASITAAPATDARAAEAARDDLVNDTTANRR